MRNAKGIAYGGFLKYFFRFLGFNLHHNCSNLKILH